VKYIYMAVTGACIGYIANHFHWPFALTAVTALLVNTLAFLVASLVDEDRR
jgi:preprotein translocase subunit SecF